MVEGSYSDKKTFGQNPEWIQRVSHGHPGRGNGCKGQRAGAHSLSSINTKEADVTEAESRVKW